MRERDMYQRNVFALYEYRERLLCVFRFRFRGGSGFGYRSCFCNLLAGLLSFSRERPGVDSALYIRTIS